MGGGGGGFIEDVGRGIASAATFGTSELFLEETKVGKKVGEKAGLKGGGILTAASTPITAARAGKKFVGDMKQAAEDQENALREMSERQAKLFEAQQASIREDRAREDRTRRRAKAQARKRLALGFLAGKQGTVKTGALGLQNPAQVARRQTGVL